jgi:hypothetical protein
MAKIPKEVGRLKLEKNGWQYIINNSLRGVDGSLFPLEGGPRSILFAFGSVWVIDAGDYPSSAPLPGQTLSSVVRLLRIDPVTKLVVAVIPLPGRLGLRGSSTVASLVFEADMCEGAGKVWLVFGMGGKGPWSNGDSNDLAQNAVEGGNYSTPYARGLVISVSPTDNLVKTINPLDNRVEYPKIVFGGGFIWVSQSPRWQDDNELNYAHGFAQEFWSPLLRIDPSSSYSPPVFGLMSPDLMPCHPTLRVFPNGLSEYPFPTFDNQQVPGSAFKILEMLYADGYLIMSTEFRIVDWPGLSPQSVLYVSRINTLSLQVKKGPSLALYDLVFCSLNKSIWGNINLGEDGEDDPGQLWAGDIDLNFTRVPIVLDDWIGLSSDGTTRVSFIYGLAFDGVEVFASMLIISGWSNYFTQIESVILRINVKNKTIRSFIVFEMPSIEIEDNETLEWVSGVPLYILYAEDGLLWVNAFFGPVFPIKQGRFGGWKVGKI